MSAVSPSTTLSHPTADAPTVTHELTAAALRRLRGASILVVDDYDLDVREAVDKLRMLSGVARIDATTSPREALKIIVERATSDRPVDLVVSDLLMHQVAANGRCTGMNGDELLVRAAKQFEGLSAKLPGFVFHAGDASIQIKAVLAEQLDAMRCFDLGNLNEEGLVREGVPFSMVGKRGSADRLLLALSYVQLIRTIDTNEVVRHKVLAHIQPSPFRQSFVEQQVSFVAGVARHIATAITKYLSAPENVTALREHLPDDLNTLSNFAAFSRIGRHRYTVISGEQGHFLRHELGTAIQHLDFLVRDLETVAETLNKAIAGSNDHRAAEDTRALAAELRLLLDRYRYHCRLQDTERTGTADPNIIVQNIIEDWLAQSDRPRVKIAASAAPLTIALPADVALQVLMQPIQNALKFSSDDVHVSIEEVSGDMVESSNLAVSSGPLPHAPFARVSVVDRGPGIPREDVARIFDFGFSTSAARTGSCSTGWGLGFAKREMLNCNGAIEVETATEGASKGARLSFYFPLAVAQSST